MESEGAPQLLLYSRIEGLRALGRNLDADTSLRNVDAVLRHTITLGIDSEVKKNWPGHGIFSGTVIQIDVAASTLYPGKDRTVYTVEYTDATTEDLEEEEIRPLIIISNNSLKTEIVAGLKKGFDYFETRITGVWDSGGAWRGQPEVGRPLACEGGRMLAGCKVLLACAAPAGIAPLHIVSSFGGSTGSRQQ